MVMQKVIFYYDARQFAIYNIVVCRKNKLTNDDALFSLYKKYNNDAVDVFGNIMLNRRDQRNKREKRKL